MLTGDLDSYSLRELVDALSDSTTELLALMNTKGADGNLMFDKMQEVKKLQEVIQQKRKEQDSQNV